MPEVDLLKLREALEASWDSATSYQNVSDVNNLALGQCYPTSRVIQLLVPNSEIVEGQVWTGRTMEKHFWNVLKVDDKLFHIDLTWQQFPHGSVVKSYKMRDQDKRGDSQKTIDRVNLLHRRVVRYLQLKERE